MFRHDDLEQLLYAGSSMPEGVYDQNFWKVSLDAGQTDEFRQMVSSHEFAHANLNVMTAYGSLLAGYAYLMDMVPAESEHYRSILTSMVRQCRVAHETFATWMSMTRFRTSVEDGSEEKYLAGNDEYRKYLSHAKRLVKGIPSLFYCDVVVQGCISFCFQSKAVGKEVLRDLRNFTISAVPLREYPDQRLQYILDHFTPEFFMEVFREYVGTQKDTPDYALLKNELSVEGYGDTMEFDDFARVGKKLLIHLEIILDRHFFQTMKSESFIGDSHRAFTALLLAEIHHCYPEETDNELLTVGISANSDAVHQFMMNHERESQLIVDEPRPCVILFPEELTADLRDQLLRQEQLLITCMHTNSILAQYSFLNEDRQQLLIRYDGVVGLIRSTEIVEENELVLLIPFFEPEKLVEFLSFKPADVPVYGYMGLRAAGREWTRGPWMETLMAHCQQWLLINDVSLLVFIERHLSTMKRVEYSKLGMTALGRKYTALLFCYSGDDGTGTVMIAPCGEAHLELVEWYMHKYFPQYVENLAAFDRYVWAIQLTFIDILSKEHYLGFATAEVRNDLMGIMDSGKE